MKELQYLRATQIREAVTLLNEPGHKSRPLAGGTDFILLLRNNPTLCDTVVDISLIPELHQINRTGDVVTIGAAATFYEVMSHPIIIETAPLLVQACRQVGAVQIRNMGTLGGNVANAAACADSLPALVCLDSVAHVLTPKQEITWPVAELIIKPNKTHIPPGGLLTTLSFPAPLPGSRSVFLKLGRRNAMAISRLTVAVLGRLDGAGRVAEVRIVTGAATPNISRIRIAEENMIGKIPGKQLYAAASRLVVEEMIRLAGRRWSTEFKEPALMTMATRALKQVFEPANENIWITDED
jgi:CO/xanthine dehydrogenase FAD-binding subunit